MAINTTALDGDESTRIQRSGCSQLLANQNGDAVSLNFFFLQRHIKPSDFLKASFSCLTAMVVASTLVVAMEPYLFQHCGVLLQSPKDIFVATLNWQWNWCFVQLPCSLWETELGYCKSISTVIVCIWTHLLVTARRQCSKWTSYGELTHCKTSLSTKGISYVDPCVNWL